VAHKGAQLRPESTLFSSGLSSRDQFVPTVRDETRGQIVRIEVDRSTMARLSPGPWIHRNNERRFFPSMLLRQRSAKSDTSSVKVQRFQDGVILLQQSNFAAISLSPSPADAPSIPHPTRCCLPFQSTRRPNTRPGSTSLKLAARFSMSLRRLRHDIAAQMRHEQPLRRYNAGGRDWGGHQFRHLVAMPHP